MALILERMDELVAGWGPADRRSLFAGAYRSMSASMLTAIDSDEFADSVWVGHLLDSFADYYFDTEDADERPADECPEVWKVAFSAASSIRFTCCASSFSGSTPISTTTWRCVSPMMGSVRFEPGSSRKRCSSRIGSFTSDRTDRRHRNSGLDSGGLIDCLSFASDRPASIHSSQARGVRSSPLPWPDDDDR